MEKMRSTQSDGERGGGDENDAGGSRRAGRFVPTAAAG